MRSTRSLPLPLLAVGLLACGGGPAPSEAPSDGARAFSSERAWAELEAITSLGARPPGSPAAASARQRILESVRSLGLSAETVRTQAGPPGAEQELQHLVATLPGDSADRIVLVAPYDSGRYPDFEFIGANDGASGAAMLLELARALSARERPYTFDFVWLEGEGRWGLGEDPEQQDLRGVGSAAFAEHWAQTGRFAGIRLLLALNRVCDADLRIARDLGSQRSLREEFWRSARRLGRTDSFELNQDYESVAASHRAFRAQGLRPVVAISDTVFGGDDAPGIHADNEGDAIEHCSPQSLAAVGMVVLDTLETIGARLAKIDRFTRMPSIPPGDPAGERAPTADARSDEAPSEDAASEEASPEDADAAGDS